MPDESVIDQVSTAVDNVSPETADLSTATPSEAPAGPSRSERIKGLSGKARDYYQRTGDVEGAEKRMPPKAETNSETDPGAAEAAQTEGAPGTPRTEQQPRTRQDRNFRQVTQKLTETERELIAAKAKIELYERQSAASGPSAPAAQTVEKPTVSDDPRPRPPKLTDKKYDGDNGTRFDEDNQKWLDLDTAWLERNSDRRFTVEQQRQQNQQSSTKWTEQIDSARKIHKDFDTVALSDKTPISFATMALIQSMPDGALRSYALGKSLEAATKIAELTHMPGEAQHKDFAGFMKWVKADPDRAMLYGEKLAIAKAELAKLAVSSSRTAAPPPKPLKEIIRSSARPSAEVNTEESAAPPQDPIARALQNIKNGVKGAQAEYVRLKNEADLRKRKGR